MFKHRVNPSLQAMKHRMTVSLNHMQHHPNDIFKITRRFNWKRAQSNLVQSDHSGILHISGAHPRSTLCEHDAYIYRIDHVNQTASRGVSQHVHDMRLDQLTHACN
jgi:hypothetical protein